MTELRRRFRPWPDFMGDAKALNEISKTRKAKKTSPKWRRGELEEKVIIENGREIHLFLFPEEDEGVKA